MEMLKQNTKYKNNILYSDDDKRASMLEECAQWRKKNKNYFSIVHV